MHSHTAVLLSSPSQHVLGNMYMHMCEGFIYAHHNEYCHDCLQYFTDTHLNYMWCITIGLIRQYHKTLSMISMMTMPYLCLLCFFDNPYISNFNSQNFLLTNLSIYRIYLSQIFFTCFTVSQGTVVPCI